MLFGNGGCDKRCLAANRASLGYIVFLSESVKDRSLHWMVVRSQISLSRAYTSGWGLERLVILLSWVPALSGPTEGGLYMGIRRSKNRERAGAWSPSMDGDSVLLTGG
jgi:hypothetical protein